MEPTIYLFFMGNCFEAMTHYADVLGGEIKGIFRNADVADLESRMPGGDDIVKNLTMKSGNATVLASDDTDGKYEKPRGFRVSIAPTSCQEVERIFEALAKDPEAVEMAPDETFWAERYAMFTDRYGKPWMLNYDGNKA